MNEERRCLIIDGHPTFRLGVRSLLEDRYAVEEVADCKAALEMITSVDDFDVVVVELKSHANGSRNGVSGMKAIRALHKARPGLGIVAHAPSADPSAAADALDAGAAGFVAKSSPPQELERAVDAAAEGERYADHAARAAGDGALTRRQREFLQLYADGYSTEDVAAHLERSTETVRTHTKAALSRLGARDRTHAVAIGLRNALIE